VRGIVDALCSNFSNKPIDHAFIYYHYLVDHGHSVDNIEILNSLVTSEEQCIEVLDNMNLVHAMYLEIAGQSFA